MFVWLYFLATEIQQKKFFYSEFPKRQEFKQSERHGLEGFWESRERMGWTTVYLSGCFLGKYMKRTERKTSTDTESELGSLFTKKLLLTIREPLEQGRPGAD